MQKSSFFFLSNTAYERSWTIFFLLYVLDIWMDLISDLVTNGLARLDFPLELKFLCIELCQKKKLSFHILDAGFSCYSIICIILVLWFSMHYFYENVVVDIDLWWIPRIIHKILFFSWFSKTSLQTYCKADINLWIITSTQRHSGLRPTSCERATGKLPHGVDISPRLDGVSSVKKNSSPPVTCQS